MVEVFSFGNGDFLYQIFTAIKGVMGDGNFETLIRLTVMLSLLIVAYQLFFSFNITIISLGVIKQYILVVVLFFVLFVPKTDVTIRDEIKNKDYSVSSVPYGVGMFAHFFTTAEKGITKLMETYFLTPNDMKFSKSGYAFSVMLLDTVKAASPKDVYFKRNMDDYIVNCFFHDVLIGDKNLNKIALESSNLLAEMSPVSSKSIFTKLYSTANPSGVAVECQTAYSTIQADVGTAATSALETLNDTLQLDVAASMPVVYNELLGVAGGTTDILSQAMAANSMKSGLATSAMYTGVSADAIMYASALAEQQQRSSWAVAGELSKKYIPIVRQVLEAFVYGVFPLLFIMMMTPMAGKILHTYFTLLIWLLLWSPLFAILNLIVNTRAKGVLSPAYGYYSLGHMPYIYESTNDLTAMAGYLAWLVPMIAFAIAKGSDYALVHMASGLSGSVLGSSAGAAGQISSPDGGSKVAQTAEHMKAAQIMGSYQWSTAMAGSAAMSIVSGAGAYNTINETGYGTAIQGTSQNITKNIGAGVGTGHDIRQAFQVGFVEGKNEFMKTTAIADRAYSFAEKENNKQFDRKTASEGEKSAAIEEYLKSHHSYDRLSVSSAQASALNKMTGTSLFQEGMAVDISTNPGTGMVVFASGKGVTEAQKVTSQGSMHNIVASPDGGAHQSLSQGKASVTMDKDARAMSTSGLPVQVSEVDEQRKAVSAEISNATRERKEALERASNVISKSDDFTKNIVVSKGKQFEKAETANDTKTVREAYGSAINKVMSENESYRQAVANELIKRGAVDAAGNIGGEWGIGSLRLGANGSLIFMNRDGKTTELQIDAKTSKAITDGINQEFIKQIGNSQTLRESLNKMANQSRSEDLKNLSQYSQDYAKASSSEVSLSNKLSELDSIGRTMRQDQMPAFINWYSSQLSGSSPLEKVDKAFNNILHLASRGDYAAIGGLMKEFQDGQGSRQITGNIMGSDGGAAISQTIARPSQTGQQIASREESNLESTKGSLRNEQDRAANAIRNIESGAPHLNSGDKLPSGVDKSSYTKSAQKANKTQGHISTEIDERERAVHSTLDPQKSIFQTSPEIEDVKMMGDYSALSKQAEREGKSKISKEEIEHLHRQKGKSTLGRE